MDMTNNRHSEREMRNQTEVQSQGLFLPSLSQLHCGPKEGQGCTVKG